MDHWETKYFYQSCAFYLDCVDGQNEGTAEHEKVER
jgi:hypothetical protein